MDVFGRARGLFAGRLGHNAAHVTHSGSPWEPWSSTCPTAEPAPLPLISDAGTGCVHAWRRSSGRPGESCECRTVAGHGRRLDYFRAARPRVAQSLVLYRAALRRFEGREVEPEMIPGQIGDDIA